MQSVVSTLALRRKRDDVVACHGESSVASPPRGAPHLQTTIAPVVSGFTSLVSHVVHVPNVSILRQHVVMHE